ncbi:MAG: recombinase family protein [Minisyncoccia bacterium]
MKTEIEQKINYAAYCRKSSESEDRQILSIGSQIDKANDIARGLGVSISEENFLTESKSAKITNNRPEFRKMVDAIEQGKISGIIVWHADRLSRNAIDSAILIDLMDRNKLIEIVTPAQTYRNTPMDKFMFMLSCTQAKMENDKKGIDIKRGLEKCASMGKLPTKAPIGYMNDKYQMKGNKEIHNDPERFELVRKMWKLMLTGTYTALHIREIATEEWGLRTKNGKKLARSGIYWIFRNPFYYGMFEFPSGSGKWHQGIHNPMITAEEFDRVQVLLGRKGKPRPKEHIFEFTGMMHCGECGGVITAETKTKRQKNGNVHTYVYYHCTKRITIDCTQGSIEVKELKKQITKEISSIEIPPEFHTFAMKWLQKENEQEANTQQVVLGTQQKAYNAVVEKLSSLIDMRASGEINPEDFAKKQAQYLTQKNELKKHLERTDNRVDQWNKTSDEMLTFIEKAQERFNNGSLQTKRSILSTLGSNLVIKDKIISIDMEKSLFPMKKVSQEVKAIKERLEPLNTLEKQRLFEQNCMSSPIVSSR